MDQKKIGSFLKQLRNEKQITQEALAEKLNVSNRTVSRWETGTNLPDISLLAELAEFYGVTISEIVDGERKEEKPVNTEEKEMARKMAEYSRNETHIEKRKMLGDLLMGFGVFLIISALSVFPRESSWGSVYSVFGAILLIAGISCLQKAAAVEKKKRILIGVLTAGILFAMFSVSDYVGVKEFHEAPRFVLRKSWSSEQPDQVVYETIFFTAVQDTSDGNTVLLKR